MKSQPTMRTALPEANSSAYVGTSTGLDASCHSRHPFVHGLGWIDDGIGAHALGRSLATNIDQEADNAILTR
jgi:hypothetical protein